MSRKVANAHDFVVDASKILGASPDLYLILNTEFEIVGVSDAYLKATLVERDNIIGRNIFDVFPDNPSEADATGTRNLRHSLNQVLLRKTTNTMAVQKYDIKVPESEGGQFTERYWSPTNSPVFDENGDIKYIIHRAEDVTEFVHLKRLEGNYSQITKEMLSRTEQMEVEIFCRAQEIQMVNKRLESVNLELESFAYVASHDLKAPLRAVVNLINWIEEDSTNQLTEESKKWFDLIRKRMQRMDAIIDGILEYSKAGKINLDVTVVDLNVLVQELVSDFSSKKFTFLCADNFPILNTSKIPLQQVFTNLVNNAVKHHNRPEGVIEVGFYDRNEFYEFFVKDDGPGIEEKFHEKIFEIFQTLKPKDTFESTGIGLSIVKKIIERLGGKVWVESEKDKGATFHFTLPKR